VAFYVLVIKLDALLQFRIVSLLFILLTDVQLFDHKR
jgi:hypothetical protein